MTQMHSPPNARSTERVIGDLDFADSVAAYLLDLADAALASDDHETCLRYCHVAATVLSRQNRTLFSPRIEAAVRAVSARLFGPAAGAPTVPAIDPPRAEQRRSLHVLSEALPAGGLTALAANWIAGDAVRTQGHVALLSAELAVPQVLADAVRLARGTLHVVPAGLSMVAQARWLRQLAHRLADHVVLHIDVSDVVCGSAFGTPGGPPVMLVNQNAHLFWTGVGCADRVVNCRGSELERHWTTVLRGAPRACFGPIPIASPERAADTDTDNRIDTDTSRSRSRHATWRSRCDIPDQAVVLVSVGSRFKYTEVPDCDFLRTLTAVLLREPGAYLVLAGFDPDARWTRACTATGGRIKVLGRLAREALHDVYLGADVYVEGFPFGTTTALLEAASCGVACVLAPLGCPPPYATDGAATDAHLPRCESLLDYTQHLHHLIRDPTARAASASRTRASVIAHHADEGWKHHLDAALSGLPASHAVYGCGTPPRTPAQVHEHWARFSPAWSWPYAETLEHSIVRALTLELSPRIDPQARAKLAAAFGSLDGPHIPLWLVAMVCNHLLPAVSVRSRLAVFRLASFATRPGLPARLRALWQRAGKSRVGAYAEYRVRA